MSDTRESWACKEQVKAERARIIGIIEGKRPPVIAGVVYGPYDHGYVRAICDLLAAIQEDGNE